MNHRVICIPKGFPADIWLFAAVDWFYVAMVTCQTQPPNKNVTFYSCFH